MKFPFNMTRVLIRLKTGPLCFALYKDGMYLPDGSIDDWIRPEEVRDWIECTTVNAIMDTKAVMTHSIDENRTALRRKNGCIMKKGDKITWMTLLNGKVTRLTGKIVDEPIGGVFRAVGHDCNGRSFSDLLHVSDKSITVDPEESAETRELDAERYNYDRQAGDFETF